MASYSLPSLSVRVNPTFNPRVTPDGVNPNRVERVRSILAQEIGLRVKPLTDIYIHIY